MRRLTLVLTLAVLAAAATPAVADDKADSARRVEKLLQTPPTPTVVLQLLEGAGDPRVQALWSASLSHADPNVRGAASRAIGTAGATQLVGAIATALATESDALAASEHADALVELTRRAHPAALDAARRFSPLVSRTLFFTIARLTPSSLVANLDLLIPNEAMVDDVAMVLSQLRLASPAVADDVLGQVLSRRTPAAWDVVKRTFLRLDVPVPDALMSVARTIDDAEVQRSIADYLSPPIPPAGVRAPVIKRPDPPALVVHDLPAGFLESHVRTSGCHSPGGMMFGVVDHDANGRPRTINLPPESSSSCQRMMALVLRCSRSIGPVQRVVILPLKPAPKLGQRLSQTARQATSTPDDRVKKPTLVKQVKLEYTRLAMKRQVEGRIWLEVVVDEHGMPREIEIVGSLDGDLNREALLAMNQWRFKPATFDGSPVPMKVVVEMEFKLR